MAFTISELNALTNEYMLGTPTDILFKAHVLLYKLMENKRVVPGGKQIDCPLEHGEANSGVYNSSTAFTTVKTETHNKAMFDWGGYAAFQTIDLDDRVQNNGDAALVNLVVAKIANLHKTMKKRMATGIYLSEADGFAGLAALFDTTTTTAYGGIKEADVPLWAAKSVSTATSPTFAGFQTISAKAQVDTSVEGTPDLYLTTQSILDAFENSLHTQARYSDQELVDAGFANIKFHGAPVVADMGQTDARVDALNTRHLEFVSHSDFDFTTPKWEFDHLTPDLWTANIRWVGQLCCNHRAAHARFTAVS